MRRRHHTGARAARPVSRVALPALLLACAALAVLPAACGEGIESKEDKSAAAQAGRLGPNELLKQELELASGKDFYFILDPASAKLKMMLSGVTLHEYDVQQVAVGTPRLFFKRREPPAGWQDRVWRGGGLSPARERDRVEVVAGEESSGDEPSEPVVPPTAEEAVDVPMPYWIRFDGGFALEIRARDAGGEEVVNEGPSSWLLSAAKEVGASLGLPVRDRMRLVLYLSEEDAAALYRSAPPDVSFLAVSH
jgi:hypothetical protein